MLTTPWLFGALYTVFAAASLWGLHTTFRSAAAIHAAAPLHTPDSPYTTGVNRLTALARRYTAWQYTGGVTLGALTVIAGFAAAPFTSPVTHLSGIVWAYLVIYLTRPGNPYTATELARIAVDTAWDSAHILGRNHPLTDEQLQEIGTTIRTIPVGRYRTVDAAQLRSSLDNTAAILNRYTPMLDDDAAQLARNAHVLDESRLAASALR